MTCACGLVGPGLRSLRKLIRSCGDLGQPTYTRVPAAPAASHSVSWLSQCAVRKGLAVVQPNHSHGAPPSTTTTQHSQHAINQHACVPSRRTPRLSLYSHQLVYMPQIQRQECRLPSGVRGEMPNRRSSAESLFAAPSRVAPRSALQLSTSNCVFRHIYQLGSALHPRRRTENAREILNPHKIKRL